MTYAVNAEAGWFFKGWYEDGVLRPELRFHQHPRFRFRWWRTRQPCSTKMMNEAAGYGLLAMVSDGVEMSAESELEIVGGVRVWRDRPAHGEMLQVRVRRYRRNWMHGHGVACGIQEFKMIPRLYVESAWTDGDETAIPVATQNAVVLSRHCTLKATYWTPTPYRDHAGTTLPAEGLTWARSGSTEWA